MARKFTNYTKVLNKKYNEAGLTFKDIGLKLDFKPFSMRKGIFLILLISDNKCIIVTWIAD